MYLNRPVNDTSEHVRHKMFRHGNLSFEVFFPVDLMGGVEDHQFRLIQFHCRIRDHPLDALFLSEKRPMGEPV